MKSSLSRVSLLHAKAKELAYKYSFEMKNRAKEIGIRATNINYSKRLWKWAGLLRKRI